jgi:hypothetical protein
MTRDEMVKATQAEFQRTNEMMEAKKSRKSGAVATVKAAAAEEEMVTVPQSQIDEMAAKVGLPSGTPWEEVARRAEELLADGNARKAAASAAVATAVAEDRRLIAAAIMDGRIPGQRQQFWADALQRDRKGTRALIASLMPGILTSSSATTRTDMTAADAEMADAFAKVTGQPLGRTRAPQPAPVANTLQPVQHTTDDALYNEVAWKMSPNHARREGIAPPSSQFTYWEDPDAPKVVMNPDGTGQWVDPGAAERDRTAAAQARQEQELLRAQTERDNEIRAKYYRANGSWKG